jgi:hypothetical protein
MNTNRENLAWATLFGGFVVFIALCVSIPLAINSYLRTAAQPLAITVQTNQGAATVLNPLGGGSAVLLPGTPLSDLEAGAIIVTNTLADTALLQIDDPRNDALIARMTLYGSSRLAIQTAEAPRYATSDQVKRLVLELQNGRLRLVTAAVLDPDLQFELDLGDGIRLRVEQAGQYSLERTNGAAQISVQAGRATVLVGEQELTLNANERAAVDNQQQLTGPLEAERNLMRNSGFQDGLAQWTLFPWNIERQDQPTGKVEIISDESGRTLHFERVGVGAADTSIRQDINQDVTDFQELRALVTLRLLSQSLPICGNFGSECPLTLRIDYDDSSGFPRAWQQGFYIDAAFAEGPPIVCVSCTPPYMEHQPTPQGQLFAYESANLLEILAQQGLLPPSRIRSVSLIFSGHSFDVEIVETALIALD